MRWRVIWEKKVSTAFSHDPEVGVKWKIQRGWRTNQAFTLGCLWVASLSRMACTSLPAGTARSTVAIETEECAMEQSFYSEVGRPSIDPELADDQHPDHHASGNRRAGSGSLAHRTA
jgi:hypothetical protein